MRLLFLVLLLICQNVWAAPFSCTPIKMVVQNKILLLSNDNLATAKIYFVKNTSARSLWIDHPVAHPSASAGWASYLRSGNWSAIVLDRKSFSISCVAIQPGKADALDCAEMLSVCVPQNMAVKSLRKGTYWLVEDQPWAAFWAALQKRI